MAKEKEDLLLLDKQLCFPIYACARKIVYHPFLKEVGLTYTQYVTMMVIWEKKTVSVHDLGQRLYLDSGTLTPVLKKLEQFGYIERRRSTEDERVVLAILTEKGQKLKHSRRRGRSSSRKPRASLRRWAATWRSPVSSSRRRRSRR